MHQGQCVQVRDPEFPDRFAPKALGERHERNHIGTTCNLSDRIFQIFALATQVLPRRVIDSLRLRRMLRGAQRSQLKRQCDTERVSHKIQSRLSLLEGRLPIASVLAIRTKIAPRLERCT